MFKSIVKSNKYIWGSENIRVEFSNGEFQGIDEYGYVKSTNDILYLYYTMTIYKKVNNKWEKFGITNTHDFPHILDFIAIIKWMLNEMDDTISLDEYQKTKSNKGEHILYSYTMETKDFFYDDFYRITKNIRKQDGKSDILYYNLYIGVQLNIDSGINTTGINLSFIKEEEIKELLQSAKGFIQYTIKKINKKIKNRNLKSLNSHKVYKGKLYQKDKGTIEEIYTKDEEGIDITFLSGDINKNNYFAIHCKDTTIYSLKDSKVKVINGYIINRNGEAIEIKTPTTIDPKVILFISKDISNKQLRYNESEIADDFWELLNEEEREEFKKSQKELLFHKWGHAIMNRTWMCRKEHLYEIAREEKKYGIDSITNNIKKVIELLIEKAEMKL